MTAEYETHQHWFVAGPRSSARYDQHGKWQETSFGHSHPGGSIPHRHEDTGPSFYRGSKLKTRPTGEQMAIVPMAEEESTFELIILDSAIINGKEPVGDTPLEALGFPAAERMISESRLTCIVRDERGTGGTR